MSPPHVLILGAGSLGSALALGLTLRAGDRPLQITVGARDQRRAAWTARIVEAHADAAGTLLETAAVELTWTRDALARTLEALSPTVVVLAASPQSAWSLGGEDDWSKLIRRHGYALTAALQLRTAIVLQDAIANVGQDSVFVNACYPDLLNALLARRQPAPLCGIGNVALIAEGLRQHLVPAGRLRLLAGHADVTLFCREPAARRALPPVWIDETKVPDEDVRSMPSLVNKPSLNLFNAAPSAALLAALAFGEAFAGHVPSPLGLPGGYPVTAEGRELRLDLPAALTRVEALDWNRERAWLDGGAAEPDGSGVRFSEAARQALEPLLPEFAHGFRLDDAVPAGEAFLALRQRLIG